MSSNAAGIQPTQAIHPPSPQWLCYVQTALAASAEPAHGNGGARRAASGVAICAAGAAACIFNCYYMKDRFRCGMSAPSRQEWCRRRSILPRLRKQRKRVKTTEIFLARMSQSRTAANAGLSIHTYMRTRSTWKKNAMSTNGHYPTHGNCKLGCPQTTTTRIIIPHEVKKKKQSTCSSR